MSRNSIGGLLRYDLLANEHRPDRDGLRLTIIQLLRQRLKPRDVAAALRIDLAEVLSVMRGWSSEA